MGNNTKEITMSENGTDTIYITLPGHPGRNTSGCVKDMLRLDTMLSEYDLPMVNLDFDENKKLIGIEVLV